MGSTTISYWAPNNSQSQNVILVVNNYWIIGICKVYEFLEIM